MKNVGATRAQIGRRALLAGLVACGPVSPSMAADGAPDSWELPLEGMERVSQSVWVKPLVSNVWVTCFTFQAGGRWGFIPCNGLIVAGEGGPVIVDTGCNRDQGALLLDITLRVTGRAAALAIATHFHNDRTGGLEAMQAANVPVFAHPFSVGLAQVYGEPVPAPVRGLEKGPVSLGPVELFYPGAGHTRDNITVWHGDASLLFGGCLLRATTDNQIGNLSDADINEYPNTIARLAERYPQRRFTVPGHGSMAGDAVAWTHAVLGRRH